MASVPTKRLKATDMTGTASSSNNGNGNGHGKSAKAMQRPALKGQWSESAVRVLRERYLWKKDGQFLEDEDGLCWRVATAVAQAETNYGGDVYETARQFYEVLVTGKFLANSPTLMNAGKDNGLQLSACFVIPVPDTIEGIFDAVKYAAIIHKSGGGTGFSFSRLRPEGSTVGTSQGVASGPVSFMRIFDAATEQVKQGGTRRGANMGILRVDHPDVEKFITCKLDGGVTNFNISVAATDLFMQAVKDDTEYDLVEPHSGEVVGRKRARAVWDQIVDAAWRSGDPGFVFIDRANNSKSNPTPAIELLEATNPCGEQWLGPYDACNLGSINLAATTKRVGETVSLDWEELERVTRLTVRFLDDVIDVNPLPLPQIQEKVRANRRIGLGVMGWADLLFLLNIPYDSDEALTLGTEIMAKIEEWGWSASRDLAVERGPFPNFAESIYANDAPVRNGTVTTVAPTGSISILADCSSGIEPIFALAFQHRVKQGKEYRILNFVNPIFKAEMERRGLWSEELAQHLIATGSVKGAPGVPEEIQRVYVTAQEISPEWHVRQQAAWQKHVDNSISKTVNLPNEATREDIAEAYLSAYDTGCKGITVFRDGCKSEQVLNIGVKESNEGAPSGQEATSNEAPAPAVAPATSGSGTPTAATLATIKPRPDLVQGYTRKLTAPEGKVYITINSDDEGPLEVFATIGRAGSDIEAMADGMGRLISLTLRLPSTLSQAERAKAVAEQLRGIGGSRSVGFGPAQVRSLPDAIGKAIAMHFGEVVSNGHAPAATVGAASVAVTEKAPQPSGNLCPQCGSAAFVLEEGCKKCHACGYSEC
jgi:ribonucleoside-diphosphate reductase alpha chain